MAQNQRSEAQIVRNHLQSAKHSINLALEKPLGMTIDATSKGLLSKVSTILDDFVKLVDDARKAAGLGL